MAADGLKWEDLRKQARQLENDIDMKLVTFSKLSADLSTSTVTSDKQPLLGDEHSLENIESEIERLISTLTSTNEQMSEFGGVSSAGAALVHTLQRHRDILQDYTHEFRRTRANLETSRQRRQLLDASRSTAAPEDGSPKNGLNRRMDHLLKEHEHIRNSDRLIDDQIAIAMETREHLNSQRVTFKAIQTRVNDLAHRFPMINSLLQRIQLRKRRDALVLAVVVALCLLFFVWYLVG